MTGSADPLQAAFFRKSRSDCRTVFSVFRNNEIKIREHSFDHAAYAFTFREIRKGTDKDEILYIRSLRNKGSGLADGLDDHMNDSGCLVLAGCP